MKSEKFFYLFAFLMEVCIVIAFFALPLFAIRLGASVFQLGLMGSTSALCYTLGSLYLGHLSDILGRKRILLLGCLSFGVLTGIISFADSVGEVILLYMLSGGVSMALFWSPFEAWIADSEMSSSLPRALGKFNIAWSVGAFLGPLAGGFLFKVDYRLPLYATTFLSFCIAGALLYFSPAKKTGFEEKRESGQSNCQNGNRGSFLYIAWVANFVSFFVLGIVRNLFPKLAVHLGMDSRTLGLLMAAVAFSQGWGFFLLAQNTGWRYRLRPIVATQGLTVLAMLLIFFFNSLIFFGVAFFLVGINLATSYTASIFYSLHREVKKGRMSGFHEAILGIGFLAGPILGGLVARYFGLRAPYLLSGALILAAIVLEIFLLRHSVLST